MKPNKENIISDILLELEKGTERADLLAKNGKKWQLGVRTFDRYWKDANERYKEVQISRQKEISDIGTDSAKEALKRALYDKDSHALDLLSQIKDLEKIKAGKTVKVEGTLISATHGDEIRAKGEIRAIKTLIGTWYGYPAPTKTANTDTEGKDVKPFTETAVDLILNEIRASKSK